MFDCCISFCRADTGAAIHQIATCGVVEKALQLLDIGPTGAHQSHLSSTALFLLLSTATTCALNCSDLAHRMLEGGLHNAVYSLLAHSSVALASNEATSAVRTQQQLSQVLHLLTAMLPSVPPLDIMVSEGSLSVLHNHAAEAGPAERIQFLENRSQLRDQICDLFLPLMHKIYTVQSVPAVRTQVCALLIATSEG